jgi:hypothetical protein
MSAGRDDSYHAGAALYGATRYQRAYLAGPLRRTQSLCFARGSALRRLFGVSQAPEEIVNAPVFASAHVERALCCTVKHLA